MDSKEAKKEIKALMTSDAAYLIQSAEAKENDGKVEEVGSGLVPGPNKTPQGMKKEVKHRGHD